MKNLGIRQTPLETATAGLDERSYFGGCSLGERSQSLMCEPVSARLLGFSWLSNRLSADLALRDFVRPIAAGTAFIV
jgi:hypothetical protein